MGITQYPLLSDRRVCALQPSSLWVLNSLNIRGGLVPSPVVLDEVVDSRIEAARWITFQFLVWFFRIKTSAAWELTRNLVRVVNLSWEESVWGVRSGGVVSRSLCFKISLSQFLLLVRLYILHMRETCDLARCNVACWHVSSGGWE